MLFYPRMSFLVGWSKRSMYEILGNVDLHGLVIKTEDSCKFTHAARPVVEEDREFRWIRSPIDVPFTCGSATRPTTLTSDKNTSATACWGALTLSTLVCVQVQRAGSWAQMMRGTLVDMGLGGWGWWVVQWWWHQQGCWGYWSKYKASSLQPSNQECTTHLH